MRLIPLGNSCGEIVNREALISIGGVAILAAVTVGVFIATDEPDAVSPDFAFEVASLAEVPSAVKAVNRRSGEDVRCVVVPESLDDKIIVSAYCPRSIAGDWAFFPID